MPKKSQPSQKYCLAVIPSKYQLTPSSRSVNWGERNRATSEALQFDISGVPTICLSATECALQYIGKSFSFRTSELTNLLFTAFLLTISKGFLPQKCQSVYKQY